MTEDRTGYREYGPLETNGGTSSWPPVEPDMPGNRKKKKKKGRAGVIILSILLILSLLTIPLAGFVCYHVGMAKGTLDIQASAKESGMDNEAVMKKIETMEGLVNDYYLFDVDKDKIEEGIYDGYVSGLGDKYAAYYSPEDYRKLLEEDSGKYQGIGVTVMKDTVTNYVLIEGVFKNTPAEEAGLKKGDYIISVNGKDTQEMSLEEVVSEIKRDDKKTALIKIVREGEEKEYDIKKTTVVIESVNYQMLDGGIGYIEVTQFIENTDEAFVEAVDSLEAQKMKGLIIDLRDNGGGLVDSCVNMVSRIIPKGDMVTYTETKKGQRDEYKSNSDKTVSVPIVILVNENTASASEIFTGCLRDYKLAKSVGVKTYGKGIVQSIIPLGDGSALKFTVSKYYSPNGINIHETGIDPDIKVEMTEDEIKAAREDPAKDTQLQKAIEQFK